MAVNFTHDGATHLAAVWSHDECSPCTSYGREVAKGDLAGGELFGGAD